ncbi:MAG: hypothetical protein ACRC8S_11930 [Fimbriiglobus sp.]
MNSSGLFCWRTILGVAVLVQMAMVLPAYQRSPDGFLYGDSNFYAAIAESIVRDQDLDLRNQCFPTSTSLEQVLPELEGAYSGEFGWAKAGYLTLKQSPLLSLAALPFYLVMGEVGFLVFNLVLLNFLIVATAKLAGDGPAARCVALVALLSTPLLRFAFNFSPDLFLCALMFGALWLARSGYGFWAGVCAGLAVSSKLYVLVLVLPVPVLLGVVATARVRSLALCVVGGVLGLMPGFILNTIQFGAPWITGYERQLKVENGLIGLADHSSRFTDPPLQGFLDLLFNTNVGIVYQAPLWCLWPVALVWAWRKPHVSRPMLVACLGVILLSFALFAPYNGRDSGSTVGNRYLFPALLAGFVILGQAAEIAVSARWPNCCGRNQPTEPVTASV